VRIDGGPHAALIRRMEKLIVYIILSDADPMRFYTGLTSNLQARLEWHNRGPCGCTTNNRPWSVVVAMTFATEKAARRFERYLKSGSGRAFSKRHFTPDIPET
jgi:putative endonuclease